MIDTLDHGMHLHHEDRLDGERMMYASPSSFVQVAYEQTPRYEGAPVISPYAVSTAVRYMPIQSFRMGAGPAYVDRSDELRGIEGSVPQLINGYAPTADLSVRAYVNDLLFLLGLAGFQATVTAGAATPDLWTVTTTGVPTGGTFTIAVTPAGSSLVTTGPINWNATAADMQTAIEAVLPAGYSAICTGGPLPTGILVTITGAGSGRSSTLAVGVNNLTGGASPAPAFAHTTTGVAGGSAALPDGGFPTTGTNVWQFTKRAGLTAKSAQLTAVYFNEQIFMQGQGYGLTALNGTADGAITGTWAGLVMKPLVSDPNLTPAFDTSAIPHLRRGDIALTWLSGTAIANDFTWAIANPLEPIPSLGFSSYYPDTLFQGPGRVGVTGTMPKRSLAIADYQALLAASTFSALASWHSPKQIGSSGYPYSMFLQMPSCQIIGGDVDPLTNARRFGSTYQWFAGWDEASGYDARFTLVSSLAATTVASAGIGL